MAGGALPPPPPPQKKKKKKRKREREGKKREGDEKEIQWSPSYAATLGELTNWPHKRGGCIRRGEGGGGGG